eukprot:TRINITY_DN1286_c0_g2_i1.p1 TRINITY_DN1286_c0_g2~~TRINITY_DN1286_c0_g2_i1.p1  ORF type:complete len:230 (+),score=73.40 TRINITY_DN1286_c0_g2_i1:73-762(+)
MGCGASNQAGAAYALNYPTAGMQAYAERVDELEEGRLCEEPSPARSRLREKYQRLRSAASLRLGGVEFLPSPAPREDGKLASEIQDWMEETEEGAGPQAAAPAPLQDAKTTTPELEALEVAVAQMDDRAPEDLSLRHVPFTRENVKRHNALLPLAAEEPRAAVHSYLFRSRFSSRSLLHSARASSPAGSSVLTLDRVDSPVSHKSALSPVDTGASLARMKTSPRAVRAF